MCILPLVSVSTRMCRFVLQQQSEILKDVVIFLKVDVDENEVRTFLCFEQIAKRLVWAFVGSNWLLDGLMNYTLLFSLSICLYIYLSVPFSLLV